MDIGPIQEIISQPYLAVKAWMADLDAKYQLITILVTILASLTCSFLYKKLIPVIEPKYPNPLKNSLVRLSNHFRDYFFALILILFLGIASRLDVLSLKNPWLIDLFQAVAVLVLANVFINKTVFRGPQRYLVKLISYPLLFLYFMGWLDVITKILDTFSFSVGNINISLNDIIKTLIFGSALFWLGKISNSQGKQLIRKQYNYDLRMQELLTKLYEIFLFIVFFFLLLEIVGIDITTLAIFGGALGVGLGFGLQSIASNFISGIIILLDRSLTVGDHIEMEDGKQGIIRELNMRCATIETYDGKDVLVPNEKFITSTFVNWTHENDEQRYAINLEVAYKTDLKKLFEVLREKISEHPQVLSGDDIPIEKRPDAEISQFADSGIEILIEFWMRGIDDGKNRVGADLLMIIWETLQELGVEIPFPQREVRIIGQP